MLESYKHSKNAFVTLTYDDEHLPPGGTLVKEHYQKFIRSIRDRGRAQGVEVRYYLCGEYGEETQRPHYHAVLFGLGPEDAEAIDQAWRRGYTFTGDLTHDSAQYVAGYVTKKMTHPESRCTEKCTHPPLAGRLPEFARMSLKPGIGALAIPDVVDVLTSDHGCDVLAEVGDVPLNLRLERKNLPLGRYLRGKLREKLHFPEKTTPPHILKQWKDEMRELRKEASAEKKASALGKYIDDSQHFKNFLIKQNAQKVLQLETKNRIFRKRKTL